MFQKALGIAAQYTFPVVMSRLQWDGKVSSSIGTFVVVNADGWALTACHILEQIQQMHNEWETTDAYEKAEAAARAIADPKSRNAALQKLKKPGSKTTRRYNVWWGNAASKAGVMAGIVDIDLGAVKFDDLVPGAVKTFPTFKDPSKGLIEPGRSLCKLGFPFHSFSTTWDEASTTFHFPPNALPMPRFPMDGIITRLITLGPPAAGVSTPAHPLMWIETSTPGLKGQSGGPTIDVEGTIWAIQCKTHNLSLGFDPIVPNGNGAKVHQFLNAGLGVHPATIVSFLKSLGVTPSLSTY